MQIFSFIFLVFFLDLPSFLQDFEGFPLLALVESFAKGERKKQAGVFTRAQILQFLKDAPNTLNKFYLVRKVVVIVAFMGGCRMGEVRNLTMDCLRRVENGYTVSFEHLKQRAQVQTSQ